MQRGVDRLRGGERRARRKRVRFDLVFDRFRIDPWQTFQRQAEADRRIAGKQEHRVAAEVPFAALPAACAVLDHPAQRQHAADRGGQAVTEHVGQPRALQRVAQLGVFHDHVGGQCPLAPQVVVDVFVGRNDQPRIDLQPFRQQRGEPRRVRRLRGIGVILRGQQCRIGPHSLAVRAPMRVQRPARQLLARILLAHAVLQRRPRRPEWRQPPQQPPGIGALGRPHRVGVPFRRVDVGGGNKCRLAAQRQAHVTRGQRVVDKRASGQDVLPLRLGIGFCYARGFADPPHRHGELEFGLARFDHARDCRGRHRIGAGGQRNMPLAGHQARGRVQPDPARTRQIDLGPGVQVGEVGAGPRRPDKRFHVGNELDQVARDEARCVAQIAQQLHQHPGGVPAGAACVAQRFLRRPDARFHAHDVADATLHHAVQGHQHIDRALFAARHLHQQRGQ
jgi:hypothetical protein